MRNLILAAMMVAPVGATAAPTYLGLYMQSHKIGFASYTTAPANYHGRRVDRNDSHTVMDTGLLGTPLHIEIDSQTWTDSKGSPLRMDFTMESQGRKQVIRAEFGPKKVTVAVDNSGIRTTHILDRPNGPIVDDPMVLLIKGRQAAKCFVLDPTTVSFVENTVRRVGTQKEKFQSKTVDAQVVDLDDPRSSTKVFLTKGGDIIRAEGPMGIVMLPESASKAMTMPAKYTPDVDLGYSTSIVPEGRLDDPAGSKELKLRITGKDLSTIPSDEVQSVKRSGGDWIVDVHPPRFEDGETIREAAISQKALTRPDLDMPSDSATFVSLARKIVGDRARVGDAALAIKDWVYSKMRPNAGIGVLRDASEVLKSKEGVCRDYAILTGTLLRSAGIATRLASGLVDWDGTFYYHAWDEVWDGRHWIGIDSTTPDKQISAAHVKLAEGTVAQAFTFAVLDKVKIKVLSAQEN
jgi:hypothetical protein